MKIISSWWKYSKIILFCGIQTQIQKSNIFPARTGSQSLKARGQWRILLNIWIPSAFFYLCLPSDFSRNDCEDFMIFYRCVWYVVSCIVPNAFSYFVAFIFKRSLGAETTFLRQNLFLFFRWFLAVSSPVSRRKREDVPCRWTKNNFTWFICKPCTPCFGVGFRFVGQSLELTGLVLRDAFISASYPVLFFYSAVHSVSLFHFFPNKRKTHDPRKTYPSSVFQIFCTSNQSVLFPIPCMPQDAKGKTALQHATECESKGAPRHIFFSQHGFSNFLILLLKKFLSGKKIQRKTLT